MTKRWENINADGLTSIETGDIEEAEFTINTFRVEDGEVKKDEKNTDVTEEDIDDLREQVSAEMDDAIEEFEQTGETTTARDINFGPPIPSPEEAGGDESVTEGGEQTASEQSELGDHQQDVSEQDADSALSVAREVVREHDIGKYDFPTFAKHMREEGIGDEDVHSETWETLRDEEVITGDDADAPTSSGGDNDEETADESAPADSVDVDVSDMEETTEQQETQPSHEADETGTDETEEAMGVIEAGQDIIVVREGHTASERAVEVVADDVLAQNILAVPLGSDVAEAIVDDLPSEGLSVPFYVVAGEEEFRTEPLANLFEAYA